MSSFDPPYKPRLWVPGDLNAFFGLLVDVLLNVMVLTGLVLFVLPLPRETVFGRILPALGLALPLGNLFYAYLAWKLARTRRSDATTALPYGPSVPHMFIVVFLVMAPALLATGNAMLAWRLGLVWAFVVGIIVLLGAFIGPAIRKYTPRAAMLGTLAGISIVFISMRPVFQIFEQAWMGLICFMIVLLTFVGRVRLPFNIPGGLAVGLAGSALAWGGVALGWSDLMDPAAVAESLNHASLHLPVPSLDVFSVPMSQVWPLLLTAIPLGIYNFTEALNNVESAAAGGDDYSLRAVLLADGLGAVAGSLFGSPFPPAVYIGHPGWKAVGGRIGYSLATGAAVAAICFLGLTAFLLSLIPLVAVMPILVFIGLSIGAQAFQASPRRHAAAVVLALIPNIAQWARTQVDGSLATSGVDPARVPEDLLAGLARNGVLYHGMQLAGGGAVLAGLLLGAVAAFVIDRRYNWAAVYAAAGALLSFFGFIHAERLAVNASPGVTFGYFLATLALGLLAWGQAREQGRMDWSPIAEPCSGGLPPPVHPPAPPAREPAQRPVIPAEPYDLPFEPFSTALLIIDMQRDFLEPGGFGSALGRDVSLLRPAIGPCQALLRAARGRGLLVIHTREGHAPDLADCPPAKLARGRLKTGIGDLGPMGRILVRGEKGHDIIPELYPIAGEPLVDKPGKGAFFGTDLEARLRNRGIRTLLVCGVTTEVCVTSTVREANDRGFECVVVADATGSYFPQFQRVALEMVKANGGIFGWVASSGAVVAALAKKVAT
jgi:AGZA family xanthine/uracil permease-like MFS transporter